MAAPVDVVDLDRVFAHLDAVADAVAQEIPVQNLARQPNRAFVRLGVGRGDGQVLGTEDDVLLAAPARRAVFWIQLLLIFGCSASVSLLPVFGATAACVVVVFQGFLMMRYWRVIWSHVISDHPRGDWHIIMFIGDVAILGSAVFYTLWETGVLDYDRGAAGFCLGAVFLTFIGECSTSYFRSIGAFIRETRDTLTDSDRE